MRGNPIREFIPDHLYYSLRSMGFLDERTIRDYYLKKKFENLRAQYSPRQIFGILQKEFPYICEDTIRKIIYTRRNTIEEDEFNFSKESEEKWKVFAGL